MIEYKNEDDNGSGNDNFNNDDYRTADNYGDAPKNDNMPENNGQYKYCSKCGAKIDKDAEICPHCGCRVKTEKDRSWLGVCSIIFGALGGLLGLIFGIIGLSTSQNEKIRKNCKIGIGLFCGWIVLSIFLALY